MRYSKELKKILATTRQQIKSGKEVLIVFDIDSTLYDVSPRLEKILIDYAHDKEKAQKFPEQTMLLKNISTLRTDWGITNALQRVGLDSAHPDFQDDIHQWWKTKFFSNDYLEFDQPYEGAVDYVNALYQIGAHIVYLTGRDQHRMGHSSPQVLIKDGFPLQDQRSELVLKPHKSMDDARFKTDWLKETLNQSFATVYLFENEPVNINLVKKELPQIELVFFKSTHSGKEEAPLDIPHIMDYLCQHQEE